MNLMVVVFIDLDGTLIIEEKPDLKSSVVDLKWQMLKIVKKYEFPDNLMNGLSQLNRATLLWNAIMDILYELKSDDEISVIRNELDKVIGIHEREDHERSILSEEAIPLLKELRKEGYFLITLTNTSRFELEKIFTKYDLSKYFRGSITRNDVIKIKPDPEGLRKILDKLSEDRFTLIDDLDYGILATRSARDLGYQGYSILVNRGRYDDKMLKELSPDAIVNSLNKIPELLKNIFSTE